jgi:hypothetical protein
MTVDDRENLGLSPDTVAILRPGLMQLVHQLGQIAGQAGEAPAVAVIGQISDEYKTAQHIAGQNAEAMRHYGQQIARRTPIEYGENYVLNNGDVGVALAFNEPVAALFHVHASKETPGHFNLTWSTSDDVVEEIRTLTDVLTGYSRKSVATTAWARIPGEVKAKEFNGCTVEDFNAHIRDYAAAGLVPTMASFTLENGDSVAWASPRDDCMQSMPTPLVELVIGRDRYTTIRELLWRSAHNGSDRQTFASLDAVDRVRHVASF